MLVVIRGAGDIATGIALRLYRAGMQVVMCDLAQPTSIRRTVCAFFFPGRAPCTAGAASKTPASNSRAANLRLRVIILQDFELNGRNFR